MVCPGIAFITHTTVVTALGGVYTSTRVAILVQANHLSTENTADKTNSSADSLIRQTWL